MFTSSNDVRRLKKGVRTAVSQPGVISVSLCHKEITVVGEGIDSVLLAKMLRKKLGDVEILTVCPILKEKIENYKKPESSLPYDYDHTVGALVAQPRYNNSDNVQDRLLLWRFNHTQTDGSLSSEEAKQKWKLACKILAEKGLIPEDENIEENERAFKAVMESEHPNSMVYEDFAMTFSNRFSNNASRVGAESGNNKTELARLVEEMSEQSKELLSLKNAMNQLMALMQQQCQVSQACLPSTSDAGKKNTGAWEDEIVEEL
ncbi:hypothetical protein M5K25_026840 [Dendrobium thyrsiflorum]|uniref:Uncharacterized protein n=1 Tax=Dendrobium thyrsiflorum TaxID=117978 RepID=A0ABD0TYJ5_DENTH